MTVDPTIDAAAVFAWRDRVVHGWDDGGQVEWLDGAGLTLLRGRGRLVGERRLTVTAEDGTTTLVEARHAVVVSTGSTPVVPPVPGLREAEPWSSEDATASHDVPGSLVGRSVAAWSASRWPPPTPRSARPSPCCRAVPFSAAPSPGPVRRWATPCVPPASTW